MNLKMGLGAFFAAMAVYLLYQLGLGDVLAGLGGASSAGGCRNGTKFESTATLAEFVEMTDAIARPWKPDAALVSFFNSKPLQPSGRATEWMAKYYSPSANRGMMISNSEGKLYCSIVKGHPASDTPDLKPDYMREGSVLYAYALEQGKELLAKGYGVRVNLYSIASDNHHAMWHLNYVKPDAQAEMYVVIDANTGKLEEVRNRPKK